MTKDTLRNIMTSLMISAAIYPIVFLGVWGLFALGTLASDMHLPSDIMPLTYGLVFAVLTIALIDILGLASVVMALIASANLIEYAQLVIPGRSASLVDFVASLAGVIFAAVLVWMARSLVARHEAAQSAMDVNPDAGEAA